MALTPDIVHGGDLPPSTGDDLRGPTLENRLRAGHNLFKHFLLGQEKEQLKELEYRDPTIPFIANAIRNIRYGHTSTEDGWQFRDPMDRTRKKSFVDLTSPINGMAEMIVHAGTDASEPGYGSLGHVLAEMGTEQIAKLWVMDSVFWNPDRLHLVTTSGIKKPKLGIHSENGSARLFFKFARMFNQVGLCSTRIEDQQNMLTTVDIPEQEGSRFIPTRRLGSATGGIILVGRAFGQLGDGTE